MDSITTSLIEETYGRTGALFQRPFGRRLVRSKEYFTTLVKYIHLNPQSHGLTTRFQDWPHSSFSAFAWDDQQAAERVTVVELFGGLAGFHAAHEDASDTHIRPDAEPRGVVPLPHPDQSVRFRHEDDEGPQSNGVEWPPSPEKAGPT